MPLPVLFVLLVVLGSHAQQLEPQPQIPLPTGAGGPGEPSAPNGVSSAALPAGPAPGPAPTAAPALAPAAAPAQATPIETPPIPTSGNVTTSAPPQAARGQGAAVGAAAGAGPLPITTTTTPSVVTEAGGEEQPACVHVPEELCPPSGELCRCKLLNGTTTVICCDVTTQLQLKESLNCQGLVGANITALHARNITLHSLDLSVLNLTKLHLPHLESLAITDGHITELKGHLDAKNLECMNVSSNSLINVSENTFSSLHSLTNLDLSGNDLQQVATLSASVSEFKLDVSGNNNLSCESLKELTKHIKNLQFSHDNNTYCIASNSFSWFNSTDKIPLSSVVLLNKLEAACPRGETDCSCKTARLDMILGRPPTFSVEVDCSNRRLTTLPPTLPKNTISLNVSSNNISNLEALSMNAAYESIRMFYADDNQITSINALEGSTFIDSFLALSLRNNNISSLPTYILSNVFDRNYWEARTVHLGLNRLKCDCSTAQTIKMWLNANYKHIPDYNEVLCENMRERVFELDQNKVCTVQSDWTEYVYYLVAAEVMLLILLISKVSYDYWVFKTAGYLPWPASKMPKLPCDWVFES